MSRVRSVLAFSLQTHTSRETRHSGRCLRWVRTLSGLEVGPSGHRLGSMSSPIRASGTSQDVGDSLESRHGNLRSGDLRPRSRARSPGRPTVGPTRRATSVTRRRPRASEGGTSSTTCPTSPSTGATLGEPVGPRDAPTRPVDGSPSSPQSSSCGPEDVGPSPRVPPDGGDLPGDERRVERHRKRVLTFTPTVPRETYP